jgi:hypothetical protein
LFVIAIVVGVATGCSTFSDNDLAAKVGDAELTQAQLSDRLADLDNTDNAPERVDGGVARAQITSWIRQAVADDVGLLDQYAAGDGSLPVTCFYVVPVTDRAQGDQVISRLRGGEEWDAVAGSISPEAAAQSRQPCTAVSTLIPEVAGTLGALKPGEPQVIELGDPVSTFVVRAHDIDELDIDEFLNAVATADQALLQDFIAGAGDSGVYVDPRFGDFDPDQFSVIPLG